MMFIFFYMKLKKKFNLEFFILFYLKLNASHVMLFNHSQTYEREKNKPRIIKLI
jgi:hypothetical protein